MPDNEGAPHRSRPSPPCPRPTRTLKLRGLAPCAKISRNGRALSTLVGRSRQRHFSRYMVALRDRRFSTLVPRAPSPYTPTVNSHSHHSQHSKTCNTSSHAAALSTPSQSHHPPLEARPCRSSAAQSRLPPTFPSLFSSDILLSPGGGGPPSTNELKYTTAFHSPVLSHVGLNRWTCVYIDSVSEGKGFGE